MARITYLDAKAKLDALDARLAKFDRLLSDKSKFQPVVKCQWQVIFGQVEKAINVAMRADPKAFCADYPNRKVLAVYHGLVSA